MQTKAKLHTTNYYNTLIEIADDCPARVGEIPPQKAAGKSIAAMQFELISKHPYKYTSDDVLFLVFAERNNLTKAEYPEVRRKMFSKGQACLRSSPLTKRYGWGIHSNPGGFRSSPHNDRYRGQHLLRRADGLDGRSQVQPGCSKF